LNEAIAAIRKFVAALDELTIDYFIGGSIASIAYGKCGSICVNQAAVDFWFPDYGF
jgi:hypothetical protein